MKILLLAFFLVYQGTAFGQVEIHNPKRTLIHSGCNLKIEYDQNPKGNHSVILTFTNARYNAITDIKVFLLTKRELKNLVDAMAEITKDEYGDNSNSTITEELVVAKLGKEIVIQAIGKETGYTHMKKKCALRVKEDAYSVFDFESVE